MDGHIDDKYSEMTNISLLSGGISGSSKEQRDLKVPP